MNTSARARIAYTGPALERGEMDVRELAPALIAFADLVEHANSAIGGKQKIRLMLNEDSIRKGSFDITFILDSIFDQAKLFVGFAQENGIEDLMTVIGWGVTGTTAASGICVGIFSLIKLIRGRKLTGIRHGKDGVAEIYLADGSEIKTDEKTLKVFLDINCRISIEKIVDPIRRDGIERFELRNPREKEDKTPIETISEEELPSFAAPSAMVPKDEVLPPTKEQEILVKIVSVNFAMGKWRLMDGTNTFWASMRDEDFNSRVERGDISFANGDMLKIRYHIQQSINGGNLSSDHIVTKVIDLIKKTGQIRLDFDYGEGIPENKIVSDKSA